MLPAILNAAPASLLDSLVAVDGSGKADLSVPSNFLHAVLIGIVAGRQDFVSSVEDNLAKTLAHDSTKPSDADSNTAKTLIHKKLVNILNTKYMDDSATNWSQQLIEKLHIMFNPAAIEHLASLPSYIQMEVVHIIYTEIWNKFGKATPEQFDETVKRAIDEVVESYSWEGMKKNGAAFTKLTEEQLSKQREYVDDIAEKAKLTRMQGRVLQLEITLLWREAEWTEKDKAKYLRMKPGNYRQHLYQARMKTGSIRHEVKGHNGYERLLKAIFGERS